MIIYQFVVEPGSEDHIAHHQVTVAEVEEVIFGRTFVRRTRQGRLRVIGQTEAGRYLTIFLASRGGGTYALITAREATRAERRVYQEQRGKD